MSKTAKNHGKMFRVLFSMFQKQASRYLGESPDGEEYDYSNNELLFYVEENTACNCHPEWERTDYINYPLNNLATYKDIKEFTDHKIYERDNLKEKRRLEEEAEEKNWAETERRRRIEYANKILQEEGLR